MSFKRYRRVKSNTHEILRCAQRLAPHLLVPLTTAQIRQLAQDSAEQDRVINKAVTQ